MNRKRFEAVWIIQARAKNAMRPWFACMGVCYFRKKFAQAKKKEREIANPHNEYRIQKYIGEI